MNANPYDKYNREVIWLTVHYSPASQNWYIETSWSGFITPQIAKEFVAIEGKTIVYMVRGFDNDEDAERFAINYHEAKADGFVYRLRLD